MTQPSETVVVDGDRIDEGRRAWPAVLAALLVGAVIGLLVGGLYGASRPASYEADTAISVLPDPTLDVTSNNNGNVVNGPASLDATAYIQSQLVVINGRQLADSVRSELGLRDRPSVTATQVGETYVVQVQATSADRGQALAVARTLGSAYDSLRTRQLTTEIDQLLNSTNSQLSAVESSLAATTSGSRNRTQITPSQTALQTQYEQLLSTRSSLRASRAQVASIVSTVSPPAISDAGLSTTVRDGLAGLVLGAILGVVVLIVVRRSVHRVRGVNDLASLGVPVLLPVQPRRPFRARTAPGFWRSAPARLLAARLHADGLRAGKPVVIVGAGPRAGATYLAAAVSTALVGRGPVLLVSRSNAPSAEPSLDFSREADVIVDEGRVPVMPSTVPGVWLLGAVDDSLGTHLVDVVRRASETGWLVVVDGDSVLESDFAAQLARADAVVALVAGRGVSSPADVLAATELFEAEGMTYSGCVLNDVPRRFAQRLLALTGRRTIVIERASDDNHDADEPDPDHDSAPGRDDAPAGGDAWGPSSEHGAPAQEDERRFPNGVESSSIRSGSGWS